jgi:hypothetical protein
MIKTNYSKQASDDFYPQKNIARKTSDVPFNLKVSEDVKYENDNQWFKDYVDYVAPATSSSIEDYKELKTNYEVLNNNLEAFEKELHAFCNPMGESIGQIEEKIIPFEKLNNKVNVLLGELLKRNDNHKVLLITAKAIKAKNKALVDAIKASVEEKVQLEIEKQQQQMSGMKKEDVDKYIQDLRTQEEPEDILNKNWLSEWEIFYSKGLKFCHYDQDIKTKKYETFKDAITADRFYVYSGWKHGKPSLEVRNPLYLGFHKAPNEAYVNKSSYVWYKKPVTISEIYDNYGEILSEQDLTQLGAYTSSNSQVDKRHDVMGETAKPVFDLVNQELFMDGLSNANDKNVGLHQGQALVNKRSLSKLVWETHIEFKAYKQLIFLTYLDDYSQRITIPVSKDFKIPSSADKIKFTNKFGDESVKYVWIDDLMQKEMSAEILWIPRKYEVIRLGTSIFPICREVPYQTTDMESPYSGFNLSTFGGILTSRNAKSVSLLQRAIPSYFQYIFIKHIQNRELSKYQGAIQSIDVDQIPDNLGKDIHGNQIRDKVATYLLYLKRTNKDFYSGTQSSFGALPSSTRSPGSSGFVLGTATELMNLQQLLDLVDREIGLSMGISPQREAAFSSSSNVTDNKQAIVQSSHITEPYFYLHSEIWKHALTDYLKNFRTWCEKMIEDNGECFITYAMPDGTVELLNVTSSMCELLGIALFVSNSGQDQAYLDAMLQMSHAFAQNAGEGIETVSALLKSITQGASPEEVHKMIQVESIKQQKRAESLQKQQLDSQEKVAQINNQVREDVQAHELEKIDRKGEIDLKKAAITTYLGMDDKDLNDNGELDIVELMDNKEIEKMKLDVKKQELMTKDKQHSEKLDVEREKIAAQKQIAKTRKPAAK